MVAVDSGKRGGNATGLRIGRNGPAAVVTGGHDNGVPDAGGRWDRWPKGVRRQLAASSPPARRHLQPRTGSTRRGSSDAGAVRIWPVAIRRSCWYQGRRHASLEERFHGRAEEREDGTASLAAGLNGRPEPLVSTPPALTPETLGGRAIEGHKPGVVPEVVGRAVARCQSPFPELPVRRACRECRP
jgi:hypothetical protein